MGVAQNADLQTPKGKAHLVTEIQQQISFHGTSGTVIRDLLHRSDKDPFLADVRSTISSLDGIVAAITQTNSKIQSRLTSAFATKLGALGVSGSAMGLLSLGTASTGTAIGALSGAAATTAKLFWVGSLVGGGVAAGAAVLGGLSIVGGYFIARKVRQYLVGAARDEDELAEEEKRIVNICRKTSIALQHELNVRKEIPHTEWQQILETFINPVLGSINEHYFKDLVPERFSVPKHLKLTSVHYARLYGHKTRLSKIVKRYLG